MNYPIKWKENILDSEIKWSGKDNEEGSEYREDMDDLVPADKMNDMANMTRISKPLHDHRIQKSFYKVRQVAERVPCSIPTVYRYLNILINQGKLSYGKEVQKGIWGLKVVVSSDSIDDVVSLIKGEICTGKAGRYYLKDLAEKLEIPRNTLKTRIKRGKIKVQKDKKGGYLTMMEIEKIKIPNKTNKITKREKISRH